MAKTELDNPLDWPGFITSTISVGSLLLALTFAAYGITQLNMVYFLLIIFALSLSIFIFHEKNAKCPLFDLRLFRIREFAGGNIAQLLNAVAWGAVLLLLSLYLQLVIGFSPFETGIRLIPFEITYFIAGISSGKLSDKYGCLPLTTFGLTLASVSLLLFSTADLNTSYLQLVTFMMLFAWGMGMFTAPNVSSIMSSVPLNKRGVASAFRNTVFNVGYAISLNLAIFLITLTVPYAQLTNIITTHDPVLVTEAQRVQLADGIRNTYVWLAALNTLAILPSAFRQKHLAAKHKRNA